MNTLHTATQSPVGPATPDAKDAEMARAATATIEAMLLKSEQKSFRFSLLDAGSHGASLAELPRSALVLLARGLQLLGQGTAVSLVPVSRLISTEDAARYLQVSRPFVVSQIEAGHLRCVRVGRQRRLTLDDVMAFERTYIQRTGAHVPAQEAPQKATQKAD